MQASTMFKSFVAACAAAAVLTVAACGGGGSAATGASSGVVSGKTTRVSGVISGFGSVIVNGVHYESGSAVVTINGTPGTVSQLKVGQTVRIAAKTDAQGVAHAETIDQDRLVQGPVQAVDTTAGTLTVAGQTIQVTADTSFDPSIPGGSLAGIQVSDVVEVYGFVSTTGEAYATRIEKAEAGDSQIEVTGPISGLDTTAKRFSVGAQAVDYSQAQLYGFSATGPADGDVVEVKGSTLLPDGTLQASVVKKEDGGLDGHDGDAGEIEGLVTAVDLTASSFEVSGQKVSFTSATTFVGGTSANLVLNARVEVHGQLDANGVLVADKVSFHQGATLQVAAAVEGVDAGTSTLQMLGATFVVTGSTRVEDDETHDQMFNLADVNVGDWLVVSGYPDPAGTGNIIVTRLERHAAQTAVWIRGLAGDLAAPNFGIAGFTIATTDTTQFWNESTSITSADFFAGAAGKFVEIQGTWNGAEPIAATRVRIDAMDEEH